jgi:hypothetical protein
MLVKGYTSSLITNSTEQSLSWETTNFSASQEIPPHIMEPEGSLPRSQATATCPYPEPYQSSPCLPIPRLEDPF